MHVSKVVLKTTKMVNNIPDFIKDLILTLLPERKYSACLLVFKAILLSVKNTTYYYQKANSQHPYFLLDLLNPVMENEYWNLHNSHLWTYQTNYTCVKSLSII